MHCKGGIGALWRGWFANVARSGLLVCGQLTGYDESKRRLIQWGLLSEGAALHGAVMLILLRALWLPFLSPFVMSTCTVFLISPAAS